MWDEEVSEGGHVGTTTHQRAPGLLARPCAVYPPGGPPPSKVICIKNSEIFKKIILNFQGILRTFIFGSFFIAREIQKTDKTWHFILFS